MARILLQGLRVSIPKPKRNKTSEGIKRTTNKIAKGKVFQDEGGIYKVAINMKNDEVHPDLRILEFTERSYDLTNKINVFSRNVDEHGRRTRFVRNETNAKYMPGLPEQYIPFTPNWIVKGYIVNDNGTMRFDFKSLVGLDGYDMDVSHDEDD